MNIATPHSPAAITVGRAVPGAPLTSRMGQNRHICLDYSGALGTARPTLRAFTLVQFMVAVAVGSMVLSAVGYMTWFATRSFVAIGNYSDLDAKSRNTIDVMSRELRQASALLSFQTNLPIRSLLLTNAEIGSTLRLTFDSNERMMVFSCSNPQVSVTLPDCDRWHFTLYQRTPLVTASNIIFYPATNTAGVLDPGLCKVINMSWQCSRSILGQKVNTETLQSAQIILRNKD